MEYLKFAIMPLEEAKRSQKALKADGIDIRLEHNEQTCRRGCSVTVEMWGKEGDFDRIKDFFNKSFLDSLEDHKVDFDLINEAFDPSKASAKCPACGHEFSTSLAECPDCGLSLGV